MPPFRVGSGIVVGMLRVGVVGTGDWGKNLVRTFAALPGVALVRISDLDPKRLAAVARGCPGAEATPDADAVLRAPDVDAVVIASSAPAHHRLAAAALDAGKDVFVEKPLALTGADAADLLARAERGGRTLMVGHLLLYHPAVTRLKAMVDAGDVGEVRYVYSQRVNLGKVRSDENALWSLAPHDISVMNHLLGGPPESVSARGAAWVRPGVEDVVFLNLGWPGGRMGQVQVSWLDPHKLRKITVVGSRKMVVFDDMESSEKLRVYDKGVDPPGEHVGAGEALAIRFGDVWIPRVDGTEPLLLECRHFVECVRGRARPLSDGREGLAVVRVLEAATESLRRDGAPVRVDATEAGTAETTARPAGKAAKAARRSAR